MAGFERLAAEEGLTQNVPGRLTAGESFLQESVIHGVRDLE